MGEEQKVFIALHCMN